MMLRNMVTSLFDGYLVDEEAEQAKEARRAAAEGSDEKSPKGDRRARRKTNRLVTTVDKAKALRPLVDRVAILAKRGDQPSYRRAMGILTKGSVVNRLFEEVSKGQLFQDRECGFMTMGRVGVRKGDAAVMAAVSLITPGYVKVGGKPARVRRGREDRSRRVEASRRRQAEMDSGE
jgi:large subunit ribosomal protein L17